jgi:murein DD-endopeptidase MepM/ murein hydrolase activator NlpD
MSVCFRSLRAWRHGAFQAGNAPHARSALLKVGSEGNLGQRIARVGFSRNTPDNGAPHLYFEVRLTAMLGTAVDLFQDVSCK